MKKHNLNNLSFEEIEEIKTKLKSRISEEVFTKYEKVRQSGVTNMFNVELVCELSGLSESDVFFIIKNYGELNKLYPIVRATQYPRKIGIVNLEDF